MRRSRPYVSRETSTTLELNIHSGRNGTYVRRGTPMWLSEPARAQKKSGLDGLGGGTSWQPCCGSQVRENTRGPLDETIVAPTQMSGRGSAHMVDPATGLTLEYRLRLLNAAGRALRHADSCGTVLSTDRISGRGFFVGSSS